MLIALVEANLSLARDSDVLSYTTKIAEQDWTNVVPLLRARWYVMMAMAAVSVGDFARAEASLSEVFIGYRAAMEDGGAFFQFDFSVRQSILRIMGVLIEVWKTRGKVDEARLLEMDLNETREILTSLSDAALNELQTELREERGAAAAGGDGGGDIPAAAGATTKKLTRKQQKRKAAQWRKAEARAAAAAEVAAAEISGGDNQRWRREGGRGRRRHFEKGAQGAVYRSREGDGGARARGVH